MSEMVQDDEMPSTTAPAFVMVEAAVESGGAEIARETPVSPEMAPFLIAHVKTHAVSAARCELRKTRILLDLVQAAWIVAVSLPMFGSNGSFESSDSLTLLQLKGSATVFGELGLKHIVMTLATRIFARLLVGLKRSKRIA